MRKICLIPLVLASACQSTTAEQLPAVLIGDRLEAIAEITEVIADALRTEVSLSPSAFSESSLLTLEHAVGSDARGSAATGLLLERPEQFRLLWSDDGCSLTRLRTGKTLPLDAAGCRPEAEATAGRAQSP